MSTLLNYVSCNHYNAYLMHLYILQYSCLHTIGMYVKSIALCLQRYHASNEPHEKGSPSDYHCRRYHTENFQPPVMRNPVSHCVD